MRAEVHRLVVIDEHRKVIGIISLSDILLYLVLRPSGEGVGGSESSLRASDPVLLRKVAEMESEAPPRSPSAASSGNRSLIEDIPEEETTASGAPASASAPKSDADSDNNKSASEDKANNNNQQRELTPNGDSNTSPAEVSFADEAQENNADDQVARSNCDEVNEEDDNDDDDDDDQDHQLERKKAAAVAIAAAATRTGDEDDDGLSSAVSAASALGQTLATPTAREMALVSE